MSVDFIYISRYVLSGFEKDWNFTEKSDEKSNEIIQGAARPQIRAKSTNASVAASSCEAWRSGSAVRPHLEVRKAWEFLGKVTTSKVVTQELDPRCFSNFPTKKSTNQINHEDQLPRLYSMCYVGLGFLDLTRPKKSTSHEWRPSNGNVEAAPNSQGSLGSWEKIAPIDLYSLTLVDLRILSNS